MGTQFTKDMNVITNFLKDMDIIAALDDQPNDVGGLTAAELKAKFDEGGKAIQEYINGTLIPEVLGLDATEDARRQAEAAREAAELERIAAETDRAHAETDRDLMEAHRADAEADRIDAEETRVSAEKTRAEAELLRILNENMRKAKEQERADETEGIVAQATEQAEAAAADARSARSWAVGGTGSRADEDTNNARYWAEVAESAAGGGTAGVVSFNGRSGVVQPQSGDYTAAQVGALAVSGGYLTGHLTMQGNRIMQLGTPQSSTDAANKGYVDDRIGDLNTILDTINGEVV